MCIRDSFYNLEFPIRFVNCLLQADFEGAGMELTRFVFNSTLGVAGFFDPATSQLHMKHYEEDLGQTLGRYGFGPGFYINIPFLGPSNLRDAIGRVGDGFLNPINWFDDWAVVIGLQVGKALNNASLTIGDYESLKEAALDPYVSIRDAYQQYREKEIEE